MTQSSSKPCYCALTSAERDIIAKRYNSAYGLNQSEFIRQAIRNASICPIITVSSVNDELLAAIGKLAAEYGKTGSNLNQIARH